MPENSNGDTNRYPVRLDFGTKISIMAALVFEATDALSYNRAVSHAFKLQELVDVQVRAIKAQSGRLPKGISR